MENNEFLETKDIISLTLSNHTKDILNKNNSEILTFYIEDQSGWKYLDRYISVNNNFSVLKNDIRILSNEVQTIDQVFIKNTFNELDKIIDIDFKQMITNNGSNIDIYDISYSSSFQSDLVVGQVIAQDSVAGNWWDMLWKNNKNQNLNSLDKNIFIHELGHILGLSHPQDKPYDLRWNTKDTVMSYNQSPDGWNTWYSKTDINALIKIWGRENDNGSISIDENSKSCKYKQKEKKYYVQTELGEEEITNLTSINFIDKTINIHEEIINLFDMVESTDHITGKIFRLYSASFARFPDISGYEYWVDKNISGENTYLQTCVSFLNSDEFNSTYGSNPSNEEYVKRLYSNILTREPDIQGQSYWINQLNSQIENKVQVLIGFAESAENKGIFNEDLGYQY